MVHLRYATKRSAAAWETLTVSAPFQGLAKTFLVDLVWERCAGYANARNDVLCMMLVANRRDVHAAMLDCALMATPVRGSRVALPVLAGR